MRYSKEQLIDMYDRLVMGRIFSEKMEEAVYAGLVMGSLHLPHGQEAIQIGVLSAMTDNDYLAGSHRFQIGLAERLGFQPLVNEILGRVTGVNKSVAFDFHCSDINRKVLQCMGTLGSTYPTYTGFAWALKQDKKDSVVVVVQGDGACGEGVVYEAWNLAALFKVPVVYVIENNQWAEGSPITTHHTTENVSDKAAPMLPTQVVDGNDVIAVREAMEVAIEKARNFEPNVVELKTYRWKGHFCGDGQETYMDMDKIEELMKTDCPLTRYENKLLEEGIITEKYAENIKNEKKNEIDAVFENAKKDQFPTPEDIIKYDWIYASPETGGDL